MTDHPLSRLRLQLLVNGYSVLPGLDRTCRVKGWNSDFIDREVERCGSIREAVLDWTTSRPDHRTTNVQITNRLMPFDCDVDDPELSALVADIVASTLPEVNERAPMRYGSGSYKVAYFTRLAPEDKPFIRHGSRKFCRPAELVAWQAEVAEAKAAGRAPDAKARPAYNHIEVFGGAPTRSGRCSRQFGIYGPHTRGGVQYQWGEGPQLADTRLADLPVVTEAQVWSVLRQFEEAATLAGFVAIEADGEAAGGEGGWVFDIDRETTRFLTAEHGMVSYAELEDLVAEYGEVRCSFSDQVTTRPKDKCLAGWSSRYECVMVTEWGPNSWHVPAELAPADVDLTGLADEFEWAKAESERHKAAGAAAASARDAAGQAPVNWSGVITQDAVALKFAEIHEDHLRFCHDTGAWFEWVGRRWQRDSTQRAFQYSRGLSRDVSRGTTVNVLKETRRMTFAGGVEKGARGDVRLAVTSSHWDANPFYMGTPDGTLDLRTGRLRPADPCDGISKLTAVTPRAVPTPIWSQFLHETFSGDAELIRFNQQWFGYGLTGDTREHALWFGFGNGGNGKGVLLNTVSQIIGDYARTAPMETFTSKKFDSHPTELAMLRGARLVSASETEEGRAWAESRIKQITGGDPVTARFMHKDFFTFQPVFKLVLIGNHKPVLRSVDAAVRRRFKLVPFMNDVPLDRQDRQLQEKLRAEWPGIMQWMVEGCLDWQRNGLLMPSAVKTATDSYFEEQDTMGQWLAEICEKHPGAITPTAELFGSWVAFSHAAGEPPMTRKAFTMEIMRRGFEVKRTNAQGRSIAGLRLRKQGGKPFFTVSG